MTATSPSLFAVPDDDAPETLDLHRWRRLDWRLLMPELGITRVACGGAVDAELRAALPLLTADLREPRTPADWLALAGSCDAVVLVHPIRAELRMAVEALRPGGWLYAEVRRRPPVRGPATIAGWRAALRRAGLREVSAYWHLPGPNGPSEFVDLAAATALRHVVGRRGETRRRNIRARVAGALVTLGLLSFAIDEGSVTGRRPVAPS